MKNLLWLFLAATFCQGMSSVNSQPPDQLRWPQWRGPYSNGMASGDAPTRWSDATNIRWKTEIPGRGHSTPVIWGDRIFLTTAIATGARPASVEPAVAQPIQGAAGQGRRGRGGPGGDTGPQREHHFDVICVDRVSGAVVWRKTAKVATPHEGYHSAYGSFASNSPVTDGDYVFASFGSRGVFCYDFNGKLIWSKDPGVQLRMRLGFGEGSAPVLDGDRLILIYDHEGASFIVALDKKTGRELWRTARDAGSNWSTPLVVQHSGRKQVVVSATSKVRGYDFETGKLIWECAGLGANTIPQPVYQNGVVYVMSGFRDPKLMAIRLGREGDLTGTDAIIWSQTRGLSYTPTPVLHENRLYVLTDTGMVSCFNATTGEPYYAQTRLPKGYSVKASPVGANGKLYLATEDGDVVVLRMGDKFEVIATNTLEDQMFIASPVVVGGELFLRGQNRLYCISDRK